MKQLGAKEIFNDDDYYWTFWEKAVNVIVAEGNIDYAWSDIAVGVIGIEPVIFNVALSCSEFVVVN